MKLAQQPETAQIKTTRNIALWWLPSFVGVAIVLGTLLYFKGLFRDLSQIPVAEQEQIVHDLLERFYADMAYPPEDAIIFPRINSMKYWL